MVKICTGSERWPVRGPEPPDPPTLRTLRRSHQTSGSSDPPNPEVRPPNLRTLRSSSRSHRTLQFVPGLRNCTVPISSHVFLYPVPYISQTFVWEDPNLLLIGLSIQRYIYVYIYTFSITNISVYPYKEETPLGPDPF